MHFQVTPERDGNSVVPDLVHLEVGPAKEVIEVARPKHGRRRGLASRDSENRSARGFSCYNRGLIEAANLLNLAEAFC